MPSVDQREYDFVSLSNLDNDNMRSLSSQDELERVNDVALRKSKSQSFLRPLYVKPAVVSPYIINEGD